MIRYLCSLTPKEDTPLTWRGIVIEATHELLFVPAGALTSAGAMTSWTNDSMTDSIRAARMSQVRSRRLCLEGPGWQGHCQV